jgi:DNA-binding transcriptional LysR family regulator
VSLRNLDLNLLKVLDVLLAERSVTRAAKTLGRTQPAISNALHRLRVTLGDDLFIRGQKGMVLTPRAEALRQPLANLLASLESALFENSFNPATATGPLRISTPDRLTLAVVPRLFERLQKLAPRMSLQVSTADRNQTLRLIEEDKIDLGLGWIQEKPGEIRTETVLAEHMNCVVRRGHPLLRRKRAFDMPAVLSFPHLIVSATGDRTAIFDELLARQGVRRTALVTVENFTSVPALLQASDMIAVFTELAAEAFSTNYELARKRAPVEIGQITTSMAWHMRREREPRHLWLREQIRDVCRTAVGLRK